MDRAPVSASDAIAGGPMKLDALDVELDDLARERSVLDRIVEWAMEDQLPLDPASFLRDPTLAADLDRAIGSTRSGDLLLMADPHAPVFPISETQRVAALERLAAPFSTPVYWRRWPAVMAGLERLGLAPDEWPAELLQHTKAAIALASRDAYHASSTQEAERIIANAVNEGTTQGVLGATWRHADNEIPLDEGDASTPGPLDDLQPLSDRTRSLLAVLTSLPERLSPRERELFAAWEPNPLADDDGLAAALGRPWTPGYVRVTQTRIRKKAVALATAAGL